MTTTLTFDVASDDVALRAAVEDIRGDQVLTWRLAVFMANQQLERALAHEAVTQHYRELGRRRRRTKAEKDEILARVEFRAGLGVDASVLEPR